MYDYHLGKECFSSDRCAALSGCAQLISEV